jgi:pimeloyl-ACP methyl ester carboxylesterase
VLLMHGFPYDPRCYDEVVPRLVAAGYRAIVPYLRGYGETRFLAAETLRSGQQAALGRRPRCQEHRFWYQFYFNTKRGRRDQWA